MIEFLKKNKLNVIRFILLIPILLVSIISISHVTDWYNISNPFNWALYLSISVEIAAMVSIMAFSLSMRGGAWGIFIIVTLIQMIGNVFYSYNQIDPNGDLFKSWVELTGPLFDSIGSDSTDVISMKRWLAFLEGGLLPIISLTSLHFFVKYETPQKPDQVPTNNPSSTPQVEEVEMSKPEENLDELDVILDESLDINEEYFQEDVFIPQENTEPENTIKRLTYKRKDE
jgi:hypothetical protein